MDGTEITRLIYMLGVLVLVAPAIFVIARDRSVLLRNLAIWLGVAAAAALAWLWLEGG